MTASRTWLVIHSLKLPRNAEDILCRYECDLLILSLVNEFDLCQNKLNVTLLIPCQVQVGEVMPFIEEILNSTQSIICDLQPQQVTFLFS